MSNEVNQAYLRAYIKNRVASSREREASTPLPTRQVQTSQGGLESLYRRADAAREQIPAPRGSATGGGSATVGGSAMGGGSATGTGVEQRDAAPAISVQAISSLRRQAAGSPQVERSTEERPVMHRSQNSSASSRTRMPAPESTASALNNTGLPNNVVKPSIAHPASVNPANAVGQGTTASLSAHRPITARNILGSRGAANAATPATPSFAAMPAVAARPAVGPAPVLPGEVAPGTPVRPQSSRAAVPASPAVEPANREQISAPGTEAAANVWSPLGAERGMKGAGVFRQQPAVVVNGTPYTVGPSVGSVRPAVPQAEANAPIETPVVEVKTQTIRIDSAHVPNTQRPVDNQSVNNRSALNNPDGTSHRASGLRFDSAHLSPAHPETPELPSESLDEHNGLVPPMARQAYRERSPEHWVREKTRREIEERLVREERRNVSHEPVDAPRNELASEVAKATDLQFRPSWEVDRFFWPEVLYHLENSDKEAFELIGKHLVSANQDGLKVMAITSGERGVGRSTVAMHLARAAAAAGLNVALLDADTCYPSLIDQLRLDMDHGWQDSLFENVPLEEVAVRSVEDNLTVFPLTSVIAPQQLHANLSRVAKFIKRIADAHDIVFLDSHRLNLEQRDLAGVAQDCCVDAAVVVVDTELSIKEKVDTAICILQGMGVASIGLVENFHA